MAKAKKGDRLSCEVCGLVVVVDEACGGCETAAIVCCEKPMAKGRAAANRKKKLAAAKKPKAKAAAKAKPAKASAKNPAKAAVKTKPAAKKRARAKK